MKSIESKTIPTALTILLIVLAVAVPTTLRADTTVITNTVTAQGSGSNSKSSVSVLSTVNGTVVTNIVETSTGSISVSNSYNDSSSAVPQAMQDDPTGTKIASEREAQRQKLLELLRVLQLYVSLLTENN